jgi:hypothetical protein
VRRSPLILAGFLLVLSTGCAAVLGLDSGQEIVDGADAEAGASDTAEAAAEDAAPPPMKDAGPKPPTCAPNTADCNGNPNDGCETSLTSPQHCGGCTTACSITQSCTAAKCCTNDNLVCTVDQDCCSGKCKGDTCGH